MVLFNSLNRPHSNLVILESQVANSTDENESEEEAGVNCDSFLWSCLRLL